MHALRKFSPRARSEKCLRHAWNHASRCADFMVFAQRGSRVHRDVFHSRCGCIPGEPVENTFKWLMAQCRARAAKVLVMPPSCDGRFSTALVDACCTSLWTNPALPLTNRHLARADDFLDSFRGERVFHSFCGCAPGKPVDKRERGLCRQSLATSCRGFVQPLRCKPVSGKEVELVTRLACRSCRTSRSTAAEPPSWTIRGSPRNRLRTSERARFAVRVSTPPNRQKRQLPPGTQKLAACKAIANV